MSFAIDLIALMTADTSLNTLCNGGIYYEYIPENFDITKNWLVYSFNKTSQQNTLSDGVAFINYTIDVKIISPSAVTIETIGDYLVNYLNGITYSGILDINFEADNHTLDLDLNVYMNSLQFNAFYS